MRRAHAPARFIASPPLASQQADGAWRRGWRMRREWPTWIALAACYAVWTVSLVGVAVLGWAVAPLAAFAAAFHSSLQHEALHGHPTRSLALNEALVFPALGVFIPYRRFRDLHLRHHCDARLTDPYDDPESWYLPQKDWRGASRLKRAVLTANGALLGRMILGPPLALAGFWRSEFRLAAAGARGVRRAWAHHAIGLAPVAAALAALGVNPVAYVLVVAYPAMALLMVRTFIEHRAAEPVAQRTAVVEAGWLMSLLFLNNNLHAVHHRWPTLPWGALPARWRQERARVLTDNADYHFPGGYRQVAAQWLLTRREPIAHPFLGTDERANADGGAGNYGAPGRKRLAHLL